MQIDDPIARQLRDSHCIFFEDNAKYGMVWSDATEVVF
jgi:hypothetical protein